MAIVLPLYALYVHGDHAIRADQILQQALNLALWCFRPAKPEQARLAQPVGDKKLLQHVQPVFRLTDFSLQEMAWNNAVRQVITPE
ncbi:MAG: hypothetical protein DDT38_01389 [Firmicutes bacterium]|nr:hypothetical protein [candidate division NPL-UPA2 bacterium]